MYAAVYTLFAEIKFTT